MHALLLPEWASQSIAYLLLGSAHVNIIGFIPWNWSALNMGLFVKQPSRMQGQYSFRSWVGWAAAFGRVKNFPGWLPPPESDTPESLCVCVCVGGCLMYAVGFKFVKWWSKPPCAKRSNKPVVEVHLWNHERGYS